MQDTTQETETKAEELTPEELQEVTGAGGAHAGGGGGGAGKVSMRDFSFVAK